MESTVVATAMPTVVASLGGIEIYSWVFSGFLLTSTVTMPLWGRLSDLYGRRPMYLAGLVLFLAGSALSGAARSMTALIAFRMLQGLGAGSLMPIGMTIVADLFGLERRARMQGYFSSVWGLASIVGPLLGGLLSDHASWRWVFYINLPFGLVAMALIGRALREAPRGRRPVIDYAGLALFAGGVSSLLIGVVEAGRVGAWSGLDVVLPLVIAAAALGAFVVVERRAAEPIVPLRLFGTRMIVAAVITGFLAGMAMFGAISFVPLFMQLVVGATATGAGWVLTPFILGWIVLSVTSARLVLRIGYRMVVIAGMVCLTGAFLLFMRWDESLTHAVAMRDVLLAGVGMGMTMVPMLIAVQSAVPRPDLGAATSVTQFFRTVGGAVGLSLMGTVMAQRLHAGRPMAEALHGVFLVGLVVCVAAVASAFLVPAGRARELARADMRHEPEHAGG
jgi:EmrB/QacA subfamily drug resistance transporter